MIINSDYSTFCIPKIWEDKRGFCPHSSLFHAFSRQDQNRLQSFFTLHLFYLQYPLNFPYFWFLLYLFLKAPFLNAQMSQGFSRKKIDGIRSLIRIPKLILTGFSGNLESFYRVSQYVFCLEECFIVHSWSIFRTRLRESNDDLHRKNDDVKVWETRSTPLFGNKIDQIKEWAENLFTLFSFTTIKGTKVT